MCNSLLSNDRLFPFSHQPLVVDALALTQFVRQSISEHIILFSNECLLSCDILYKDKTYFHN